MIEATTGLRPSRPLSVAVKYGALVGLPLLGVFGILRLGERPTHAPVVIAATTVSRAASGGAPSFELGLLLAQLITILVAARLVGWALRRIGQPQVVGEMAAGLLLGPSFLGWIAPGVSRALFPAASLGFLNSL